MTDLRPISLCNMAYKIIYMVLANRVKQVIDSLISDSQSAFIPGRLITYIMIAYEVLHFMKRKTKGKDSWMALKLDMSKAYDRIEWNYLEAVVLKMGFDEHVVQLFMSYISSVSYRITHAGRNFGNIIPERGLRQGDPLSSNLFLICIEVLSSLINDFECMKLLKGVKVARTTPPISHRLFADDSYIFCKANLESANRVLELLKIFELASGQQIDVDKSSVFFNKLVLVR